MTRLSILSFNKMRVLATRLNASIVLASFILGYGFFYQLFKDCPANKPCGWIFDYQTILTGVIAAIAAFFTIKVVREQISSEEKRHEAERKADREAKLSVYIAAVNAYIYQLHYFFSVISLPSGELPVTSNLEMSKFEWGLLPKKLPKILEDWEYFAQLPAADIKTCVSIRNILEACVETITGIALIVEEHKEGYKVYARAMQEVEKDLMHRDKQLRNLINSIKVKS